MSNFSDENWRRDSDTIFTAISTGDFDDFAMAKKAVFLYLLDPRFSRAGISHALKRLERFYKNRAVNLESGT